MTDLIVGLAEALDTFEVDLLIVLLSAIDGLFKKVYLA